MNTETLRNIIHDDINTLPENALETVREFVLFQKSRHLAGDGFSSPDRQAVKDAAFARILKNRKTIDRDIDVKKELCEALDEKYKRFL